MINEVVSDRAAWIVIHADENGKPGLMLGRQPVSEGTNEIVQVTIRAIFATRTMHAVLYEDKGKIGVFEKGIDVPALYNGRPVATQFQQIVE